MNARVAALFVAATLLASACGDAESSPPLLVTTTTSTPTTPPESTTPPVAGGSVRPVEQVDCPAALERSNGGALACGIVTVPIDRDDPSLGATSITVATLAGTDEETTTPLAVLQGGPGGASTGLGAWLPQQAFTQVFVDQRGTGFAGPDFDCPEVDEAILATLTVDSLTAIDVADAAYDECARRLGDDVVLAHTDSVAHAADVVDVMASLGYAEWVVYGVSYGSTIGLEVLRSGPPGLVGAVLDGVYPTDLDTDAGVVTSAERAVDQIDAACAADPSCAAFVAPDGFRDVLERVMADLAVSPMSIPVGTDEIGAATTDGEIEVVLDGARVAELSFLLMYHESLLRFLPAVVNDLDQRNEAAADWLVRTGARQIVSSQAANDEGTYFGVQCHDRLPFTDGPGDDLPAFGAAVAAVSLARLCAGWDREPAPPSADDAVRSATPTLLLSGEFDPITPPAYATDVARGLGRSIEVVQGGRGHGIWYGSDCIASIVERFTADPDAVLDTACADTPVEIEWAAP
ncbi:MAG: alpha/beta hydrolase [Acidimicrobiales bacterium]